MKKFIRAVALANFRPDGMSEEEQIKLFEDKRPKLRAKYERNNDVDPTAIALFWGPKKVAYVNIDDKRWIMPLLDKSKDKAVMLNYSHTVYSKNGGHTILKYCIEVDQPYADEVRASDEWLKFNYTHPLIKMTEDHDVLEEASYVISCLLDGEDEFEDISLKDCVDDLCKGCKFDISIETTKLINECCIKLEQQGTPECIALMEQLEEASTHRRSRNSLPEWAEWFENLVKSESAERLYKQNHYQLKKTNDKCRVSKKLLESDLECLEKEILSMPTILWDDLDNPAHFFHHAFYTNINRAKFRELISALVLRRKLQQALGIVNENGHDAETVKDAKRPPLEPEWLCEWAKASNDKTVISVISQALMAYSVKENDEELYRQVGDLMSSCGEKKIVNVEIKEGGTNICHAENVNAL